jgi:ribonuclease HII
VATLQQIMVEAFRLRLLAGLDQMLENCGYTAVAGVDEAGRGCLAGPVVAAAVIPDMSHRIPGVDDSKAVAPARRRRLARKIRESAVAWTVASASPETMERINILEATRAAMAGALDGLDPQPDCAVVDAVSIPSRPYPSLPVIRGDGVCYAVACASILAKVERDGIMRELDQEYPFYGFASNKGYAAQEHRRALAEFGPSPVHRLTFRSVVPRRAEGLA